jgi:hypothetical protein
VPPSTTRMALDAGCLVYATSLDWDHCRAAVWRVSDRVLKP